jgi:hypothetical protein
VRNAWRLAALLAALAATGAVAAMVAVALIGPGGGGEDQRTATSTDPGAWAAIISSATPWACPTASPSATITLPLMAIAIPLASPTPSAAEVLLRNASLRQEDLPDRFRFQYDELTTNGRHVAIMGQFEEPGSLGVTQEELDCWGRILGYAATYDRIEGMGRVTARVLVTVDLFEDPGGASQYLAWLSRDLSNPVNSATWKRAQGSYGQFDWEWHDVTASPISFTPIGNERIAGEMAAALHNRYDADLDFEYAAKAVAFRSGRAVGIIIVRGKDSAPSTKQLEDLARKLEQRMKDALE